MKRSQIGLLLAVLLLLSALVPRAWAAQSIDLSQKGELIIEYVHEGKPITGAMFALYRVADVDANGMYTLCGDFADYPVDLTNRSDSAWRNVALTLNAFAKRDMLNPDYVAEIDEFGFAVVEDLEPGLYLLTAEKFIDDYGMFTSVPALAPIPAKRNAQSDWYYSVTVIPKSTFQPHEGMGVTSRRVLKIWDDEGSEMYRPEKRESQLLGAGGL